MKTNVAILGATGYTGVELLRILLNHPSVKITGLSSERFSGIRISDVFPSLSGCDINTKTIDDPSVYKNADVVFSCLPNEKSAEIVPELIKLGKRVIDLSAAFRFSDSKIYKQWYHKHPAPELLKQAVYGLPELFRKDIKKATLVANPGCYPVSVLLPVIPLVKEGIISPDKTIIIDSKSGVTGAGRNPSQELHFSEVNEGFRPYKPMAHRHQPEMESIIKKESGKNVKVAFVPHLLPINRGILSSIYFEVNGEHDFKKAQSVLERFYKNEKFVKILDSNTLPNPAYLKGSNYCYISMSYNQNLNHIVVFSAIDNLGKGASGNAVQNMNIMMGFDEAEGIIHLPLFP